MDGKAYLSSVEPGGLARQLQQVAQKRDLLDMAQFQFVGLEEIESAYGERWPKRKDHIREGAERFLRSRMGAQDILVKAHDGFIIIFGSESGAEAEVTAGQLAHGLNEMYLGESATGPTPRTKVSRHSVPTHQLAACLGDIPFVARAPSAPTPKAHLLPPAMEWRYQPVWDVKREALSSWYVTPYSKQTGKRVPGYLFENTEVCADQFSAVDESCIWVSEQAINELLSQEKQAQIGVTIHVRTLTNIQTRARILSVLDRLDPDLSRYRVVKIAGVAPGFPRLYLNEFVRLLKGRTGNVVIGAALDEPDMASLIKCGAVAIGVTIPSSVVGIGAKIPLQTLLEKVGQDVRRAHAERVRFYVDGEIDCATVSSLAVLGVNSIASPRVWPALGAPDAMLKRPASGLAA